MRKTSSAVLVAALTAIVLTLGVTSTQAQRRVQLINMMTTSWKYDASGIDQMTAWQARTFNDASWQSGFGLIGVEDNPIQYAPYMFNTTISPYNQAVVTYYFRAHFNMAASDFVWPLTLQATNLVDDGCVVYLNSSEVVRLRVATAQNYMTLAGNQAAEGTNEVNNVSTNGLLVGDNVIAVEVHQSSTASSDIVHGFSLTAIVPTALSITSQPPATVSTTVNTPFTLSVGVAGGPGVFQWQTNNGQGTFVNIPLANNSVYTATPLAPSTVIYRVVVSNGVNTVISSNSTVTTSIDTSGPIMLSANVMEEATRTNRIQIIWNERLTPGSVPAASGTNFTVVLAASNITVTVSNVLYNPSGGPNTEPITILTMSTTNWYRGSNYYIIVNRVRDLQNNVIAPNSVIGVSWPLTVNTNLMDYNATWQYHTDWALGDPTIYQQPWYAIDYNTATNGHWGGTDGLTIGVTYKDPIIDPSTYVPCKGTLGSDLGTYVHNPTLFRSSFVVPTNLATNVTLRVTAVVDDGYVLYLNGTEIRRDNVNAPAGTLVNENTLSINEAINAQCYSNNLQVVLRPGTNVVAAAVCQFMTEGVNGGDTYWGLRLDVTQTSILRTGSVPPNGTTPRLTATRLSDRNVTFTWPTNIYGYALEFTTNITRVGQNTVLGPWYQAQTNMAIGMVTNYPIPVTSGPAYIFRLHKVP